MCKPELATKMNQNLDPIISRKLSDFRTQRNLILLRGLCSGILSSRSLYVIALIDYLSQARIQNNTEVIVHRYILSSG